MGENNKTAANISWADPEIRVKRIAAIKAAMNRPEVVAKLAVTHATDAFKVKKSVSAKAMWQRPAYRRCVTKGINILDSADAP